MSLTLLALLLAQVKYRLTTKQARMLFRELPIRPSRSSGF